VCRSLRYLQMPGMPEAYEGRAEVAADAVMSSSSASRVVTPGPSRAACLDSLGALEPPAGDAWECVDVSTVCVACSAAITRRSGRLFSRLCRAALRLPHNQATMGWRYTEGASAARIASGGDRRRERDGT
jgi:hypothetical protein